MPNTEEEWIKIAYDFNAKWQFPNCLGALDGKHVNMRCPKKSGSLNFNYKHTFSIVHMALADANGRLTYIDVGCKGRISDGGVFARCSLYSALENNSLNIPPSRALPNSDMIAPFVIVADDAFALKTYMLKPYNFRSQSIAELVFSYRLSRARRMVESTFGDLTAVFRLLRTTIELSEVNVIRTVLAICALHNWLLDIDTKSYREYIDSINRRENQTTSDEISEDNASVQNDCNDAKIVRETFKNYFMGPGQIPWQNDMV